MDRCHTYKGVHIPGCFGCAVFGHDRCTCPPRPSIEGKVHDLTTAVKDLKLALVRVERALSKAEAQAKKESTP